MAQTTITMYANLDGGAVKALPVLVLEVYSRDAVNKAITEAIGELLLRGLTGEVRVYQSGAVVQLVQVS